MKYSPHEYQRYATEYIETHPVAAVLLSMGLGKTSITLNALNDLLFDSFEIHYKSHQQFLYLYLNEIKKLLEEQENDQADRD